MTVIGEVGTILGRHAINIASFALGRRDGGAVGVVNLDVDGSSDPGPMLEDLREVRAVRQACLVRLD